MFSFFRSAKGTGGHTEPAGTLPAEFGDKGAAHFIAAMKINDFFPQFTGVPPDVLKRFAGADFHAAAAVFRTTAFSDWFPIGKECVDQHGGQPYPGTVTLSDDHIVPADPTDACLGCRIFEGEFRQKVGFILLGHWRDIIYGFLLFQQRFKFFQKRFKPIPG